MPWRHFLTADLIAAALWATYMTMLGYFGGTTFENDLWKPILAAGIVAAAVAAAAELLRRLRLSQLPCRQRRLGGVATQRPAKPFTPVRFR